jgi:large subunit ribosomal protein L15
MAELHELSPVTGSTKNRKRVGRGPGSGTGKTSGRGENGQKARSGGGVPAGFEGGQMPLHRRIPKRGFTNINRVEYQVVNVSSLSTLEGAVDGVALRAAGLVRSLRKPIKILGDGELTSAVHVTAHAFSNGARSKIEAAGGTATVLGAADQA